MPARSRMTMRATVQRNGASADGYGSKGPPAWADLGDPVPCYAWHGTSRRSFGVPIEIGIVRGSMFVPLGTDITKNDRISTIKDRRGTEIFGRMDIDGVETRRAHLEVRLRKHA